MSATVARPSLSYGIWPNGTARTVCKGGDGMLATESGNSLDETWGNGAKGSINGIAGKGGDGFMFLVVRADQVNVRTA